jgi:hypothetical protein
MMTAIFIILIILAIPVVMLSVWCTIAFIITLKEELKRGKKDE